MLHEVWIQSVANCVLQQRISAARAEEEHQAAHSGLAVGALRPGPLRDASRARRLTELGTEARAEERAQVVL